MPALKNARHEKFAVALADGETADAAYRLAGLRPQPFASPSGCYVYLLIDPFDRRVFYVGKGSGDRALHHAKAWRRDSEHNKIKSAKIGEIETRGGIVVVHVLADGMTSNDALRLERMMIVRAHKMLTNISLGEKPEIDRVRADARRGLAQIKPLCVLLKERPSAFRLKAWFDVTTSLARISRAPG